MPPPLPIPLRVLGNVLDEFPLLFLKPGGLVLVDVLEHAVQLGGGLGLGGS